MEKGCILPQLPLLNKGSYLLTYLLSVSILSVILKSWSIHGMIGITLSILFTMQLFDFNFCFYTGIVNFIIIWCLFLLQFEAIGW